MAEATGLRQTGCPWWALRDPFVAQVRAAHRWWKEGQLAARWPLLPNALADGIEIYDGALNAAQVHEMRDRQKRDEQKRKTSQSMTPLSKTHRRR